MKEFRIVCRTTYSDGIVWDDEDFIKAIDKADADAKAKELIKAENEENKGVSFKRIQYIFEVPN